VIICYSSNSKLLDGSSGKALPSKQEALGSVSSTKGKKYLPQG
jgi:hypothetical protein